MRDEYSTFGWVIERMLTDVGFTLQSVDYHAPLHGTYLLRKPKPDHRARTTSQEQENETGRCLHRRPGGGDLGACLRREPDRAQRIFAGTDDDAALFHRRLALPVRARPKVSWRVLAAISFTLFLGQFLAQAFAIAHGVPVGLSSVIVQSQALFTIGFAALLVPRAPERVAERRHRASPRSAC